MRSNSITLIVAAAAVFPLFAQAQTAMRVPFLRDAHTPAAPSPSPANDLLTAARRADSLAMGKKPSTTLNYPYGIAVDVSSNVYVTNLFGGVNVYSSKFVETGAITAGLSIPAAVSISFNGNIYVANNSADNITIYNPSLTQVGTISDGSLVNPQSMFIDSDDTVWVLDAQGTLHAYLNDGTTLPSTHTGGTLVGPWGPYVTVWGIDDGNGTYIEAYENRAQAVNASPNLYNLLGESPYAGGEAQDQYAQEYVTDLLHDQVQIWDRTGAYLMATINTPATPYGVAVDSNLNRVYVALTTINEVYCYSTKPPYKLLGIIK